MGYWSKEQRIRLAYEKRILEEQGFDHFKFYDLTDAGNTKIKGNFTTSYGNSYELCIKVVKSYPYEMPNLYVSWPSPLKGFCGKTIQSYGTSHSMHVWESDWRGYAKICYSNSENWNPSLTFINILMKGMLWLEAFEVHKHTGNDIDNYSLTYN